MNSSKNKACLLSFKERLIYMFFFFLAPYNLLEYSYNKSGPVV